jgi:lysophospholipase L1-like esterase
LAKLISICLALLFSTLSIPADSTAREKIDFQEACSVTLEGDSIMWGGFVPGPRLSEPPAAILKRMRPAYTVVDNSVNSSTATQRAKTFASSTRTTRFVVLQHGINDALIGSEFATSLYEMAKISKKEGRIPIITGLTHQIKKIKKRDYYDLIARQVAIASQSLFADWGSVRYRPQDMADEMHPGQAYADRLVARLVALLDQAAPECTSAVARIESSQ